VCVVYVLNFISKFHSLHIPTPSVSDWSRLAKITQKGYFVVVGVFGVLGQLAWSVIESALPLTPPPSPALPGRPARQICAPGPAGTHASSPPWHCLPRPPGRRPRPPGAHALLDQSAGAPSCPIHGNLNIKLSCRSNPFACRSNPFACRSNYFACRSNKISFLIPKSWLSFNFLHRPTSFYLITL
jgi:hypothetical protein